MFTMKIMIKEFGGIKNQSDNVKFHLFGNFPLSETNMKLEFTNEIGDEISQ